MSDLVFRSPLPGAGPVALVFGATDAAAISVSVDIAVTLGGVAVSALVSVPVQADLQVTLGGVEVSVSCFYDNRVTPWLDTRAAVAHQVATASRTTLESAWVTSEAKRGAQDMPWAQARATSVQPTAPHTSSLPQARVINAVAQLAGQRSQSAMSAHQAGVRQAVAKAAPWQLGADRRAGAAISLQTGVYKVLTEATTWQRAEPTRKLLDSRAGASLRRTGRQCVALGWQHGGAAAPGRSVRPIVLPPVVPPVYVWTGDLLFQCPPLAVPHLLFGAKPCGVPDALLYILPARFYMTSHTIYAQRLPDLAEVPIFDATVSADAGSYCWTLSASGPASLFDLLAPVAGLPVQLRVTMDGIPWVFAVDSLSRSGSFGKTGVSISGRSVTALIGAPYLRATTRDNAGSSRLAQQLASDALEFTGVDLDWGLTDWLVPAGAWSHQGTPLDAVQAIAQAAGGYLQSHRNAPTLLTRHPYGQRAGDNPGAPWGWMTGPADVELAPDSIITDGTERKDGADINAVYVSGTTQGVLGLVKRTGTTGDKLATMVTDPLITHVDAARQRGLSILGAAGSTHNVRLELPVLTGLNQPGVLDVGQLVQINAAQPWRGRVRSVSVNAKRPSLRQTVTLERHLEAV